jgi:hypothetical protein
MIIMVVGEVVAFLIIIGYLVMHEVRLSLPACYVFMPTTQRQFHLLRRSETEATYSSEGAGINNLEVPKYHPAHW